VEGYDGRAGTIWVIENGRLAQRRVSLGDRLLDGRILVAGEIPETAQIVIDSYPGLREGRGARAAAGGS
jgi:HlyD family secretion protein